MFDYAAPSLTALLGEEVEINLIGQDRPSRETLAAVEAAGIWTAAKELVVVVDVLGEPEGAQPSIEYSLPPVFLPFATIASIRPAPDEKPGYRARTPENANSASSASSG